MIEESYVSFDTAKLLKEVWFDCNCHKGYEQKDDKVLEWEADAACNWNMNKNDFSRPTQALAARWLREVHNVDVMIDVYNRDYYCCNIYKNKHLMIIKNIVSSDYIKVFEDGLKEAVKLIKK